MRSNEEIKGKRKSAKRSASRVVASEINAKGHGEEQDYLDYDGRDIFTLKYEVNDKGIGQLLLPPSLSFLLQSDRVSISPSAGGLFIRSI